MVGLGFALCRGVVIFLWSIVWAIVAGIVAVLITGGTLAGVVSNPAAVASNPAAFLAAFFVGIFLSVLIATIGLYASIVKVTVDGAISQLEKSGLTARSSYPIESQPTLTAARVLRIYCPICGNSIPAETLMCPCSGARL